MEAWPGQVHARGGAMGGVPGRAHARGGATEGVPGRACEREGCGASRKLGRPSLHPPRAIQCLNGIVRTTSYHSQALRHLYDIKQPQG